MDSNKDMEKKSAIRELGSELAKAEGGASQSNNMDVQQHLAKLSDKIYLENPECRGVDFDLVGPTYKILWENGKNRNK